MTQVFHFDCQNCTKKINRNYLNRKLTNSDSLLLRNAFARTHVKHTHTACGLAACVLCLVSFNSTCLYFLITCRSLNHKQNIYNTRPPKLRDISGVSFIYQQCKKPARTSKFLFLISFTFC